jgi:hypothetical protein
LVFLIRRLFNTAKRDCYAPLVASKGLTAGIINTALALAAGVAMPFSSTTMQAMIVGFLSYGASLVL